MMKRSILLVWVFVVGVTQLSLALEGMGTIFTLCFVYLMLVKLILLGGDFCGSGYLSESNILWKFENLIKYVFHSMMQNIFLIYLSPIVVHGSLS